MRKVFKVFLMATASILVCAIGLTAASRAKALSKYSSRNSPEKMEEFSLALTSLCRDFDLPFEIKEAEFYSEWKEAGPSEIKPLEELFPTRLLAGIDGEIRFMDTEIIPELEQNYLSAPDGNNSINLPRLIAKERSFHFYLSNVDEWVEWLSRSARETGEWIETEKSPFLPCVIAEFTHRSTGTKITIFNWSNSPADCTIDMEVD